MKVFHLTVLILSVAFGLSAFAHNNNNQNPDDPWSSCPPGFSRDVFDRCEPDYTFPGGQGRDDDGTPHNGGWGTPQPTRYTCYAKDSRGKTYGVISRSLNTAKRAALNQCASHSPRPSTCRSSGCY